MQWKHSKTWVYSITYDEGCADILKYALPLHEKYCIPGHVSLVAGHIGSTLRYREKSDEIRTLSKDQISRLCKAGWGISCNGMTSHMGRFGDPYLELVQSRRVLQDKLDAKVLMFCVSEGNNDYSTVRQWAEEAGYDSIMTVFDNINTASADLLSLRRVPLCSKHVGPFYSAFDPYNRIYQAMANKGWIIDYCHCPMPAGAITPWKDCTIEQLEERFKRITRLGKTEVWLAEPNEVVKYLKNIN